ncbi:MAG: hypothetical protein IPO15_10400 [Anaerolineae bacterium]|uniref:hypothetical protein n=1 Tax=Candidatus Amarolinea dominans TaxID=3140696 RepID=UPI003137418F|nr:hypothetical protein [Anaerolineae bacterium]
MSHKKKIYLGDSESDEHTIVFYKEEKWWKSSAPEQGEVVTRCAKKGGMKQESSSKMGVRYRQGEKIWGVPRYASLLGHNRKSGW